MTKNPKLRKTFKAKIKLKKSVVEELWFLSRIMVHLWNLGLRQAEEWLREKDLKNKKAITAFSFNYWLKNLRDNETEIQLENGQKIKLDKISNDASRQTLARLASSWQSFFRLRKEGDNRAFSPKEQREKSFQSLSWSSFTIRDGSVFLPIVDGKRIQIPLSEYLKERIDNKKVVFVTVYIGEDNFEISLVAAQPRPKPVDNPSFFRAVDLGAGNVAISDSCGVEFLIPTRRPDRYARKTIQQIERRLKGLKKGGRREKRRRKSRRKVFKSMRDQQETFQRKLARAIVEPKIHCLIVGKPRTRLGLAKSKTGTRSQHWGSQNTGYMFKLLIFLKEKAEEFGVRVIELPDPHRQGNLDDAVNKFFASRSLLRDGMKMISDIKPPDSFTKKNFKFSQ